MALNADHRDLNEAALSQHNKLRALHRSPNLTIDWVLARSAQEYADKLARTNSFSHSDSKGQYGENLASAFNSKPGFVFSGSTATQNWYDEIKDYNFNEERQQTGKIGHFSQVVWKGTKTAGFGRAKSSSGNFIIVGQYKPPGNFLGQFRENVQRPTGAAPRLSTTSRPDALPRQAPPKQTPLKLVPSRKVSSNVEPSKQVPIKQVPSRVVPSSPAAKPATTIGRPSISSVNTPKSKDDKLIKKCIKTITENGKVTTITAETFITPKGQTYELTKTQKQS